MLNCENSLPDLILLDLQMPVMDGLSFLKSRKKYPMIKDIPVVLMSGEDDVHLTGKNKSVSDVLQKPLSMKSVVMVIEGNLRFH